MQKRDEGKNETTNKNTENQSPLTNQKLYNQTAETNNRQRIITTIKNITKGMMEQITNHINVIDAGKIKLLASMSEPVLKTLPWSTEMKEILGNPSEYRTAERKRKSAKDNKSEIITLWRVCYPIEAWLMTTKVGVGVGGFNENGYAEKPKSTDAINKQVGNNETANNVVSGTGRNATWETITKDEASKHEALNDYANMCTNRQYFEFYDGGLTNLTLSGETVEVKIESKYTLKTKGGFDAAGSTYIVQKGTPFISCTLNAKNKSKLNQIVENEEEDNEEEQKQNK